MKTKVLILDAIGVESGIKEINNIVEILGDSTNNYDLRDHDVQISAASEEQILGSDKIIISGSPASVYDDVAWLKHLDKTLELILKYQKTTLAVCFGAQFVAHFLGTKVTKNPAGTEFGAIRLSLTASGNQSPILQGFHQSEHVHGSHNDYISSLPHGAQLLAYNDNSPIQAFQYNSILATQFHPDVPVAVLRQLLAGRKEKYFASGFLKGQAHYDQVHEELVHGMTGYTILKRFLAA